MNVERIKGKPRARTQMEDVVCQDCGGEWMVNPDYLEEGLEDGRYVRGRRLSKKENQHGQQLDHYEDVIYGVCPRCRHQQKEAVSRRATVEEEGVAIQVILARLRQEHPEWSLEEAAHQAVEEFNDPSQERDPAFRKFLVHREIS